MSGSASRRQAIEAVTSYSVPDKDFTEPLGELFGKNVVRPVGHEVAAAQVRSTSR